MATYNTTALSLMDITKSNFGSESAKFGVVELLSVYNPVIADMLWNEAMYENQHKVWLRDSLPSVEFGTFNEGTTSSKATQKEMVETMGFIEGLSEVDERHMMIGGKEAKIRWDQDKAFVEAISQKFATSIFYGDIDTDPNGFKGLSNRYNSLSGNIGKQVINGGGSGNDNTSIHIVTWGDDSTYGIYPKGVKSGIQIENKNKGESYAKTLSNGKTLFVKGTKFTFHCGLAIADYRNNVRIANIDVSDLAGGSPPDLIKLLNAGIRRIPIPPSGFVPVTEVGSGIAQVTPVSGRKTAIYCSRLVYGYLEDQANAKTINGLTMGQAFGTDYPKFRGIPIRPCDAILNTESAVS
ncbi:major capsid protein [Caudoviricetes sp.]|nr:major capsid protein [Caudoviricetes sp.]